MKKWRILLAALLAVAMICTLIACGDQKDAAGESATITFYNNGQVHETVTAEVGQKLTLPKAPKAEKGLGLAGWSTIDGDVEEIIDPETFVVYGDMSLYAVWADVFTITINADNGTPFEVKEVLAGTTLEKPADPVKEGCRFVEWRDALQDVTFDFSRPIYNDVILKAMYGDGSPNRVSDTKWDFSGGIHGAWTGGQGGWKYEVNGLRAEDMVYKTTEDGYAAWGYTLTDSLDNIPVVNGNNPEGLGMKYIYNEGISVEASKAKLVVIYLKPKYFPIDMATSPNDQFRISVLTSNGGMIYGYGNGSDAWSLRTDGAGEGFIQVDQMEDGWIRVQYKIHKLDVWSEDAIIKSMSISFVQRKATPVMDIISVKSIELLDQEEFIDPHKVERTTKSQWDMSNSKDAGDWDGYHAKKKHDSLTTKVTDAGLEVNYQYPGNGWKGLVLENTLLDISKLTGKLSFTYNSQLPITSYRIHILTDLGGKLTANGTEECYVAANISDIDAGKLSAWTRTVNKDGSVTVTFDLNSLAYFANGAELKGLTIVTVTANKVTGTVTYKTIEIEKDLSGHDCEAEGHYMKEASCLAPMTCYVCGATEGTVEDHTWEAATCQHPKTCSVCRKTEGTVSSHKWSAATCQKPMTCTVCGQKYGAVADHRFAEGFCSVCGIPEVIRTEWDMRNEKAAADWSGYHAKKKNEALTTNVTYAGFGVEYQDPGNGWKGIILEKTAIATDKLTGKLTFTYSSDMPITSYRIHLLTDLGGKLTANGTADCYIAASIADITAGKLEAWTQTTNPDGSVTVTFDLSTMGYFANGKELRGLTIVTVTANKVIGTVTYKTIALELDLEGYDCQTDGHMMKDATCTEPKTCRVCGATEGEALGHDWVDATCADPKTCRVCGTTEGEPSAHVDADGDYKCDNCGVEYCSNHKWIDATCTAPKTCSICGATEGEKLPHTDANKDHVCDVCVNSMVIWYMNHAEEAADWAGYHSKKKNEALTTTVTEAGLNIAYGGAGNGWKGIVLENTAIDISKLGGKLRFTYSSDMNITSYRIHILTDLGGNLTANGTADCYTSANISNIVAGNLAAWTQTTNSDGSVTVTFDLSSMGHFANGTELNGLTIVTVTANGVTGTVTYKIIELEKLPGKYDCQTDGHIWNDVTCTEAKTCTICGATEGAATGHDWADATCTAPKTCTVCGATEGEPAGHRWANATCTAPKTCSVCGATEGDVADHTFENGVCTVCGTAEKVPAEPVLWDMSKEADAAAWAGYHAKKKNEKLTTTVTEAGLSIAYGGTGNGWKGVVMENVALDISKLGDKLIFNYSSDMAISSYRIHIVTDLGGNLTGGNDANFYATATLANITAGSAAAWTQTTNPDGSITVTFDLSTMGHFANGTELRGLTIVTVTANGVTGTVTYKTIGLTDRSAENDCQIKGHTWSDATCTTPKTCSVCGETKGEAAGHTWSDTTCTAPKTCSVCGATEGEAAGHSWNDATCTAPKTCTVCGATEGTPAGHSFEQCVCTACGAIKPAQNQWDMSNAADASDWAGYHSKKNEALTTTVTEAGFGITYETPGNGWKGIVLERSALNTEMLSGKLTFTYSSDMNITSYRIHLLTDLGGNLTSNGTANNYVAVSIANITAGKLEAWTQTTNSDGSVTVTFDLSSLGDFVNGTELRGLTIVTVTANGVTGTVTYKSIALEESPCWSNGHTWSDATCQTPKTCDICGKTEGETAEHTFAEGVCTVCGAEENVPANPIVWNMANGSQWYSAQAYSSVKPSVTTSEVTADGFQVNYFHKNAWKGIVLKNVQYDITGLNQLSFTYIEEMAITKYRVHVLTDKGGDLDSNTSGTPSDYYAEIVIDNIAQSSAWTRTVNADGSITVTFDLTTLPFFAEGKKLLGMDIVTVTETGTTGTVTYKTIAIR